MSKKKRLHAIGDIHGMLGEMLVNLEKEGVVDANGDWSSGTGTLVLTGDLVDRGPEGYEVLKKAYDLKIQAEQAGGKLVVTMGNHDAGFLNCAVFLVRRPDLKAMFEAVLPKNEMHNRKKFFDTSTSDPARYQESRYSKCGEAMNICLTYAAGHMPKPVGIDENDLPDENAEMRGFQDQVTDMFANGMNLQDLLEVTQNADVLTWAVTWPSMYVENGMLFQHCDSRRAYQYLERLAADFDGSPLEKVNHATNLAMLSPQVKSAFGVWKTFTSGRYWEDDIRSIVPHLKHFAPGTTKVIHGHTRLFGEFQPSEYAEGKAINLDVGLAYSPHHFGKTGRMVDLTENKKPR